MSDSTFSNTTVTNSDGYTLVWVEDRWYVNDEDYPLIWEEDYA